MGRLAKTNLSDFDHERGPSILRRSAMTACTEGVAQGLARPLLVSQASIAARDFKISSGATPSAYCDRTNTATTDGVHLTPRCLQKSAKRLSNRASTSS